jgi:hypothetical protein
MPLLELLQHSLVFMLHEAVEAGNANDLKLNKQ